MNYQIAIRIDDTEAAGGIKRNIAGKKCAGEKREKRSNETWGENVAGFCDSTFRRFHGTPRVVPSKVSVLSMARWQTRPGWASMATPWPDKPCPHCQQVITDLLLEMVPDTERISAEYKAINDRKPGGAITCPYCQHAVEYDANGEDLLRSTKTPLRCSRTKTEGRAKRFGQVFLNKADTTPEEWAEHDKGMPGAFRGYHYAEDP